MPQPTHIPSDIHVNYNSGYDSRHIELSYRFLELSRIPRIQRAVQGVAQGGYLLAEGVWDRSVMPAAQAATAASHNDLHRIVEEEYLRRYATAVSELPNADRSVPTEMNDRMRNEVQWLSKQLSDVAMRSGGERHAADSRPSAVGRGYSYEPLPSEGRFPRRETINMAHDVDNFVTLAAISRYALRPPEGSGNAGQSNQDRRSDAIESRGAAVPSGVPTPDNFLGADVTRMLSADQRRDLFDSLTPAQLSVLRGALEQAHAGAGVVHPGFPPTTPPGRAKPAPRR